jgi:hypothetical protein
VCSRLRRDANRRTGLRLSQARGRSFASGSLAQPIVEPHPLAGHQHVPCRSVIDVWNSGVGRRPVFGSASCSTAGTLPGRREPLDLVYGGDGIGIGFFYFGLCSASPNARRWWGERIRGGDGGLCDRGRLLVGAAVARCFGGAIRRLRRGYPLRGSGRPGRSLLR